MLVLFFEEFGLILDTLHTLNMSQQSGYSPNFKRPAEIMRMRRKRAQSDAGVFRSSGGHGSTDSPGQSSSSPAGVRPFSPGPLFNTQNSTGGGRKRKNPFANIENTYSPRKKLVIYTDNDSADSDKLTDKEEYEGKSAKECRVDLSLSARLNEAEKQEISTSKVGYDPMIIRFIDK